MARPITNPRSLLDRPEALLVLRHITDFTFGWYFLSDGPLPEMGLRMQVRDGKGLAPDMEVSNYEQALLRGDTFPPIVVTQDGHLVDGATRVKAAKKAGIQTFPQFVLTVDTADAPETLMRRLFKLGTRLNQINGRRMTRDNVAAIVEYVLEEGDTPSTLAARLNCSPNTVSGVLATRRGQQRARDLGIDPASLPAKHWQLLGYARELLNSEFIGLAELAGRAHFTAAELRAALRACEKFHTENDKLAYLAQEMRQNADRVAGLTARAGLRGLDRSAMRRIIDAGARADETVEHDPELQGRHRRTLEGVRTAIEKMLAAQDALENSVTPLPVPGSKVPAARFTPGGRRS